MFRVALLVLARELNVLQQMNGTSMKENTT